MMHSVHTTMLYSLEGLQEVVQWNKILKLQSPDGSFLSSPAATAVAYMKTGDSKCLEYLTYIVRRSGSWGTISKKLNWSLIFIIYLMGENYATSNI